MPGRRRLPGREHEAAVAVRAFDPVARAHGEIEPGMAQGAAAVAGDFAGLDLDRLRGRDSVRHVHSRPLCLRPPRARPR